LLNRKELGKMIKIERAKLDITQQELAKMANISQSTLFFLEKGSSNTRPRTILKVLKTLNLNIDINDLI